MAKTSTPFFSLAATGLLGGMVAAVRRQIGPQYLRRPPLTRPAPTALQLAIRNAHSYTLAALRFATLNTNAPRPYAAGYAAAWRALADAANTWPNHAQARFAAYVFENSAPVFPIWQDMTAHQRNAWNAAAAYNTPAIQPVEQRTGTTPPKTTTAAGLALLLHEFAAPWSGITNPPDADYPPMYRTDAGIYTRALWDFALTPWDGAIYLWDNCTIAVWSDVAAPLWDDNLAFWDAR